jgi:hypothetical protein
VPDREVRTLQPVTRSAELAILKQGSDAPVIRSFNEDGFDYACGECSKVLVEKTADGELWDLAFRCHSCGEVSACPELPAGRSLPAGRTVGVPPGQYLLASPVEHRAQVVLAGTNAIERRSAETGEAEASAHTEQALTEGFLLTLIMRAQVLLGDLFDPLEATHKRGLQAATPPRVTHRLMELLDEVEQAAVELRWEYPTIDPGPIAELSSAVDLLERWHRDPAWPGILASLKNPTDFPHAVITLAAASVLRDLGNGVELNVESREGIRAPDLRVATGSSEGIGLEVKTPQAL